MTENIQTAQILQFPIAPRADKANAQARVRNVVERPVIATVESGSGWYHDAAIQDANPARLR